MEYITKRLPLEEFTNIYSKVPRLCVDVIIKNETGGILLTRRAIPPAKGMWHIPGGTVLYGESLEHAIKRVAKNELGLDVKIIGLMKRPVELVLSNNAAGGHAVSIPYFVKVKRKRDKIKLNKEASDYGYFLKIPFDTIEEQKNILKEIMKCVGF